MDSLSQAAQPRSSHRGRRTKLIMSLLLVIAILIGAFGYLLMQYRRVSADQQKTIAAQTAHLTTQLGKTVSLPSEQPTLATVLNKAKLGDQQLAAEAKNGDQLLIYARSRRVILYRPSTKKVVDMFHVEAAQASQK